MSTFDEQAYLAANPDVAAAVAKGTYKTGYDHYKDTGVWENRALDPSGRTDPTARWRYGDVHWTKDIDPEGAQRLYDEIAGITGRLPGELQQQLWSSPGFGMRDKNMQAMVGDLYRKGVRSLSDLTVDARPIMESVGVRVGSNGNVQVYDQTSVEGGGEWRDAAPEVAARIKQAPEYVELVERAQAGEEDNARVRNLRLGKDSYTRGPVYAEGAVSLDTGKQTGNLINRHTGEIVSAKHHGETLDEGFGISHTAAGKGKTNFMLFPVPVQGPDGQTTYQFVPGTTNTATGLNKFMQDWGPALGVASMFLGMPGVAAGMGTAGTVAQVGLGTLNAANAFNQGNVLGGIASLAGAGGVGAANLGASASTMNTIKNIGLAAQAGQAIQNKDVLGLAGAGLGYLGGQVNSGANDVVNNLAGGNLDAARAAAAARNSDLSLLNTLRTGTQAYGAIDAFRRNDPLAGLSLGLGASGVESLGGIPSTDVQDALRLADYLRREDYLNAGLLGLDLAEQRSIPGTGISTKDAASGVSAYRNVRRGNPVGAVRDIVGAAASRPQERVEMSAGGRIPPLSKYMTAGV
jgi:hypothetical protein